MQDEFAVLQRLAQLVFERELLGDSLAHLLLVEKIALACLLGLLERGFGIAQERVAVGGVVRKERNSKSCRHPQLGIAESVRVCKKRLEALLDAARQLFAGHI